MKSYMDQFRKQILPNETRLDTVLLVLDAFAGVSLLLVLFYLAVQI